MTVVFASSKGLEETLNKYNSKGYDLLHIVFTHIDMYGYYRYTIIFRHNPDR